VTPVADLGALAEHPWTGARLPEAEARGTFAQIARGLAHAHACGVAHRDVKPDNVLCFLDGRVVVADYSVACVLEGEFVSEAAGTPGADASGRIVTGLHRLGFDFVFSTEGGNDAFVAQEAEELAGRPATAGPLFSGTCSAWVNYVEQHAPDMIPHLSSCRSPLGIFGAIIRNDWAKKMNLDPHDIYHVAIMPCTAKKDEIERVQLRMSDGTKETDLVITTRELMRMLKARKVDFKNLPDTEFDRCYSIGTGAGAIFCGSGGVMEAAIRSAYSYVTGKPLENLDIVAVRGAHEGIKIATANFDGVEVGVAVAQGIANAMKLVAKVRAKDPEVANVKFIEVMACPGGCVCGGGATKAKTKKAVDKRVEAAYKIDKALSFRRSHENPELIEMYKRFMGEPGGHTAHHLLHTEFVNRK